MIRMILADDEPVIIRGIHRLLDWEKLGIEIIGEYDDGRKALEAIVRDQPDIALLDISMPGMSGVEILKECRAIENKVAVIFISGFQDFEYARAALEYGAEAYLLKPVNSGELLKAVEKSIVLLRGGDDVQRQNETGGQETGKIDYGSLVEAQDIRYVPVYADILYSSETDLQMKKLIHFSMMSFLEEYLADTKQGIVFQKNDKIVLVLKEVSLQKAREIIADIWSSYLNATGHKAFFVIGDEINSMGEIPAMFNRCMDRSGYLFFADRMQLPVIGLHDQVFKEVPDLKILEKARQKLFEAVIAQNEMLAQETAQEYDGLVCRAAEGKKEDACFYFCTAVRFMEEKCEALGLPSNRLEMKGLLDKTRACSSFGKMAGYFNGEVRRYYQGIKESVTSNDKKDILRAKEFIENHYMENLSLNVLAEEIHMNPYYFSSFFKKSTGANFKDYVNQVRVRHAVSMLVSTDLKIYEIAEKAGFGDVRAFNEAFQRVYQETPGNYRKRVKS